MSCFLENSVIFLKIIKMYKFLFLHTENFLDRKLHFPTLTISYKHRIGKKKTTILKTHWFWDQMPPSFEKFDVTLAFEFVGNKPH